MTKLAVHILLVSLLVVVADAYSPIGTGPSSGKKASFDLKKAAMGAFAAVSLASSIATTPASAIDAQLSNGYFATTSSATTSTSTLLAAKVVKEGIYREYEIDLPDEQQLDDAKSTFKSAKETKSKKGKYTALLSILVVGSFIIPMAQYFWYVRDDDSTDRFFNEKQAPPEPPKKKGWF